MLAPDGSAASQAAARIRVGENPKPPVVCSTRTHPAWGQLQANS
jgi:hypothetical protein